MRPPLSSYVPICNAIEALFHPHVEVVLHDLATQKIFYIANSFSKRRAGDSSLNDIEADFAGEDAVIGPYPKTKWDGGKLKSITAVIRGRAAKPAGLLCINHDIDVLTAAADQLRRMIELPLESVPTKPLLSQDWREHVNTVIGEFLTARKATLAGLKSSDLDELMGELDARGIFGIRRAVPYVVEVLQLSRATIYNRLAAIRKHAIGERTIGERATGERTIGKRTKAERTMGKRTIAKRGVASRPRRARN
jgi:predicted transcriptional regulator YheO